MDAPDQPPENIVRADSTALTFRERHYTVAEVATMWNLSMDTVRRLFEKEPDVLVLASWQPRSRKRPYRTLRIPETVAARVYARLRLGT